MKDEILKQARIFYTKQGETEETLEPCKRGVSQVFSPRAGKAGIVISPQGHLAGVWWRQAAKSLVGGYKVVRPTWLFPGKFQYRCGQH